MNKCRKEVTLFARILGTDFGDLSTRAANGNTESEVPMTNNKSKENEIGLKKKKMRGK